MISSNYSYLLSKTIFGIKSPKEWHAIKLNNTTHAKISTSNDSGYDALKYTDKPMMHNSNLFIISAIMCEIKLTLCDGSKGII